MPLTSPSLDLAAGVVTLTAAICDIESVSGDEGPLADAIEAALGGLAHLASGTTVMHEGFVNFNAGTLGASMVEGRISQGVVVGDGSDIGGGASTMGTLSGGGTERVRIGRRVKVGDDEHHRLGDLADLVLAGEFGDRGGRGDIVGRRAQGRLWEPRIQHVTVLGHRGQPESPRRALAHASSLGEWADVSCHAHTYRRGLERASGIPLA